MENSDSQLPEIALRAALRTVCRELEERSEALAIAVKRSALDWWAWREPNGPVGPFEPVRPYAREEALSHILTAIRALTYEKGQKPVGAKHFPGLVCIPAEVLTLVGEVNYLKSEFEKTANAMAKEVKQEYSERRQRLEQMSLLRFALRKSRHADINYWQARRPFVLLDVAPRSIGYSWMHYQDITTKTVAQVREAILEQNLAGSLAEAVARDLAQLKRLPETALLGRRMTWTAHPRANIVMETTGKVQRFSRSGSLPIFMPGDRLPPFRPLAPAPMPEGYRARRSDIRLEVEPIVTTIPFHRFTKRHRKYAEETTA